MYEALDTCADDRPRAHWPRLRGVTGIHTFSDLRGAQDRAPRGVKHAVILALHDHESGRRVMNELAVCESLSGSATPRP